MRVYEPKYSWCVDTTRPDTLSFINSGFFSFFFCNVAHLSLEDSYDVKGKDVATFLGTVRNCFLSVALDGFVSDLVQFQECRNGSYVVIGNH